MIEGTSPPLPTTRAKRPASHKWAIACLCITTFGFIIFVVDISSGRARANSDYWIPLAILFFGAVALVGLRFGGQRKWAYYVVSGFFAAAVVRSIYVCCWHLYYIAAGMGVRLPYFNLARRDRPFVVEQHVSSTKQLMVFVVTALTILLFVRIAFGRPSRRYYGLLPESETGHEQQQNEAKTETIHPT